MAADKTYTLSFRARSKPEMETVVVVNGEIRGRAKWDGRTTSSFHAGLGGNTSSRSPPSMRRSAAGVLISGLAAKAGEYWFTDISVKQNQ